MRILLVAAIAALSFAGSASAHHLWLELIAESGWKRELPPLVVPKRAMTE
jgi:hypothetical protein